MGVTECCATRRLLECIQVWSVKVAVDMHARWNALHTGIEMIEHRRPASSTGCGVKSMACSESHSLIIHAWNSSASKAVSKWAMLLLYLILHCLHDVYCTTIITNSITVTTNTCIFCNYNIAHCQLSWLSDCDCEAHNCHWLRALLLPKSMMITI